MNQMTTQNHGQSNGNGSNGIQTRRQAKPEFHAPLPQSDEDEIEAGMRRFRENKQRLFDALDTLAKRDVHIREQDVEIDGLKREIAALTERNAALQADRDDAVSARSARETQLSTIQATLDQFGGVRNLKDQE